jgi:hypothetical protein
LFFLKLIRSPLVVKYIYWNVLYTITELSKDEAKGNKKLSDALLTYNILGNILSVLNLLLLVV